MPDRRKTLTALVTAQLPLGPLAAQLRSLEWDSDELVELRREHVVMVLERFLQGALSTEGVRVWADLVEGRDDIGLEAQHLDVLRRATFQLSTPETEGVLDEAGARSVVETLKA